MDIVAETIVVVDVAVQTLTAAVDGVMVSLQLVAMASAETKRQMVRPLSRMTDQVGTTSLVYLDKANVDIVEKVIPMAWLVEHIQTAAVGFAMARFQYCVKVSAKRKLMITRNAHNFGQQNWEMELMKHVRVVNVWRC